MRVLFAESDGGLFPEHFWPMIAALAVVFVIALGLKLLGWRVIDWITPGNLGEELLGKPETRDPMAPAYVLKPEKKPNVALAIVVGAMFLGLSFILGCTIIGVMVH